MNSEKIKLNERFSIFELSQMFNVDCDPDCRCRNQLRVRYIEESYAFNDIRVPLLINSKRKQSKRIKFTDKDADTIKADVTTHEPGTKGRVADLIKFYEANAASEESAFTV